MLELNRIYNMDVLEGLRMLDDGSVDLVITSPPYNKAGLNGWRRKVKGHNWGHAIDYGGVSDVDRMPEDEYEDWQVEVLDECYRVLKDKGSMFYNHKNRIVNGKGYIISPFKWLYRSKFLVRQEIVWDRISSPVVGTERYLPTTEQIYWLAKVPTPTFKRCTRNKTEVWRLAPDKYTEHPAPFPVQIPDSIIPNIGENMLVLDPFMGSGTVAISALKNNCRYIGFEKFQQYIDLANARIRDLQL